MNKNKFMTSSRKVILGFLCIIFLGALLLMLPCASRAGQATTFSGALFTSVSATCVTGLVVYDTWSHWTVFGQLIILTEIQIGGLGFITIGTFAMVLMRKKIGVSRRALIQDSLSTLQLRGGVRLVRRIIFGTLSLEGIGALLLAVRFIPEMGVVKGLYSGVFHAVSAFCNGGFDLMGYKEPYNSLCAYAADPVVILVVSALIIIGGIGFIVWDDVIVYRTKVKNYHFHSKLVLMTTAALLVGSTLLFLIFEKQKLLAGMNPGEKFLAAFFSAVTPRTAGFNSIDTGSLSDGGLFLTIALMFIGGSPGSTAGGIKTITFFVILLSIKAYLFREKDCTFMNRRVDDDAMRKAGIVVFINLFLTITGLLVILAVQPLPLREILFEVFSAIGTAGMSTGVTRQLQLVPRIVIMMLMFCGRMGSLTFAMAFTEHRKTGKIRYPEEKIMIG